MGTLRPNTSRLRFVTPCLISLLLISLLTIAAPIDGTGEPLFYLTKPYNKLLGLEENSSSVQTKKIKNHVMESSSESNLSIPREADSAHQGRRTMVTNEGTISLIVTDSKGKEYDLTLTSAEYLENTSDIPIHIQYLETRDGSNMAVIDYSKYVEADSKISEFADAIYENAESDYDFIYEVWYIVTRSTMFSADETEEASRPISTILNGKGDCEDLTILMASILVASSYTKDWDIKMVYFDAFNAGDSATANHVALFISTNNFTTFVESTNPQLNGLAVWEKVDGWYVDIRRDSL
jgi:hypothetical protein